MQPVKNRQIESQAQAAQAQCVSLIVNTGTPYCAIENGGEYKGFVWEFR